MQKHKVNLRRFHAMVLDLAKTIKEDYVHVQIYIGGNSEKYAYQCYINKVGWTTAYPEINDPRVCLAEMKASATRMPAKRPRTIPIHVSASCVISYKRLGSEELP